MALWRCDLCVSRRSQLFSLSAHGVLILLILLLAWPLNRWSIWLLLVALVFQTIGSQRRINSHRGEIVLLAQDCLLWRKHEWKIKQPVWAIDNGILLCLKRGSKERNCCPSLGGKRLKLWLASDSMDQQQWRHLRQILLAGR